MCACVCALAREHYVCRAPSVPPYTEQKHVSQETHNCVCEEGGRGTAGWVGGRGGAAAGGSVGVRGGMSNWRWTRDAGGGGGGGVLLREASEGAKVMRGVAGGGGWRRRRRASRAR